MTASPYRLRPSNAARTVMCAGSVALCEAYPQEPTPESMAGDAAHWAASELLRGNVVALGQCAPNGITLTDEMIEAAELYANHIKGRGSVENVEIQIANSALHPTDNGGTPDHYSFVLIPQGLHIFIDDFKFGHGHVEVFANWQMMDYAALILESIRTNWYDDRVITITFTIVQPRDFHRDGPIRIWTVNASELRGYFNMLRGAFEAASMPGAKCKAADPEICDDCSGRVACEAALVAASNSVPHAYNSTPLVMSPAAMSLEARILRKASKRLAARLSGLDAQIEATIKRGHPVPGNKLDNGNGRIVWLKSVEEISTLGKSFSVPLDKHDVITPTQAIAAFKKAGLPPEIVEAYSYRQPGATKLVEYDSQELANVFKP